MKRKFIYLYPHSPQKSFHCRIPTWVYRGFKWICLGLILALVALNFFQLMLIYQTQRAEQRGEQNDNQYHYYSTLIKDYSINYSRKQGYLANNLSHFSKTSSKDLFNLKKFRQENPYNFRAMGGKGEVIRGSKLVERYKEKLIDDKVLSFQKKNDYAQIIDQDILSMKDSLTVIKNFNTEMGERKDVLDALPILWPVKGGRGEHVLKYQTLTSFSDQVNALNHFSILLNQKEVLVASAQGKIKEIVPLEGKGYLVVIKHPFHFSTYYRGVEELKVKKDDLVNKGQMIGTSSKEIVYQIKIGKAFVAPSQFTLIRY